jgi:hypothetical protein
MSNDAVYVAVLTDNLIIYLQSALPIETQVQNLGQKYMGARPENHVDAMFRPQRAHVKGNHPVPVSNFLNAQCKLSQFRIFRFCYLSHKWSHLLTPA